MASPGGPNPFAELLRPEARRQLVALATGPSQLRRFEKLTSDGVTRLDLRVHRRVGVGDDAAVVAFLGDHLGSGGRTQSFVKEAWIRERTLGVRRIAPIVSDRGKVAPIRIAPKD